jgi:DNA-binding MarR family transcriptional regulator
VARAGTARARTALAGAGAGEPLLDQSGLMHLVGYATALVAVATRKPTARALAALGLRVVDFTLLVLVDTNPDVNQKRLGETLDISPPNLAVVLDRLAECGWLRRERDERDRRAWLLRLTPAGRALCRRARRASETSEAEVVSALTPAERALLIELLHRLIRGARLVAGGAPATGDASRNPTSQDPPKEDRP